MSTLDELRHTLEQQAELLDDTERHARPVAVRSRIRSARRRRTAAVAAATVVTLAIAGGTASTLRGSRSPQPAGPSLAEVTVPVTVSVYGFPYALSETRTAAADGSVDLPDATSPRAVTLVATGLGSGAATLWSGPVPIARVRGDEQFSAVTDGADAELRIELDGAPRTAQAEVAVYEPTGELAPGTASNGVVFRQSIADEELVAASFGQGGDDASAAVPDVAGELETSVFCRSSTAHLYLHHEGTEGGVPCSDMDQGNDPGAANQGWLTPPLQGEDSYRVYVTVGEDGPRADGVDVRFGVGIYRRTVPPTRVFGSETPTVLEYGGRTWRLDQTLEPQGDEPYDVDTASGDVLVGVGYDGVTGLSPSWGGAPEGAFGGIPQGNEPQGPGVMYPGILLAGDHEVQVSATGREAQTRLLVYRPE